MSDDLSMGALSGSVGERAAASIAAGCDMLLHCNGKLEEMAEVADNAPPLAALAAERADRALALRVASDRFDAMEARLRLASLLGVSR
jgi:beta-N-acetylhexosaminidase